MKTQNTHTPIVSTKEYVWANGKNPKGFGTWAFRTGGSVYFITGSYGKAKKEIMLVAREKGLMMINLLS